MNESKRIATLPAQGFENTGNICFFNALLQALLGSKNFQKHSAKVNGSFNKFYKDLLPKLICNGDQCFLEPQEDRERRWDHFFTTKILQEMNAMDGNQSASEYFLKLVEFLNMDDIVLSDYLVKRRCLNCQNIVKSVDKTANCLINHSLTEFFESEDVIEDVLCDNCKVKTSMHQSRIIKTIPPLIVISLNKYYDKKCILYGQSFEINNHTYNLIGTVLHQGVLGAGHYLALVNRNGKNYLMDDNKVYEFQDEKRSFSETYMLVYEKE
jgi:ubiquitin C-terminal hydrolase